MRPETLRELLERVSRGEVSPAVAADELSRLPFVAAPDVMADTHRHLRTGAPEAVFCAGKTPEQAAAAFEALAASGGPVVATRARADHAGAILERVPGARHEVAAGMVVLDGGTSPAGTVAVVCAGTSDVPVALEAAITAETFGAEVDRVWDVGVAGLHRLLSRLDTVRRAGVVVAVAGMEGALPSVLAGLVAAPVVAVPTSVGYGAAFGGLAALLAMLNACAPGVTVVNIDNGYGAAVAALKILQAGARREGAGEGA